MTDDFNTRAQDWLNSHDTGISSESIFYYMALGLEVGFGPSDPADLGRCIRLLDRFPEWKPRLPEMTKCKGWQPIIERWDEIVSCFEEEAGNAIKDRWGDWSAPKTYAMMKAAYEQA